MTAAVEVARVFREEQGRILASLIGAVRDFELAEESLQDAFAKALIRWPKDGVPRNPAAWINRTARNRAIDRVRRRVRWREREPVLTALAELERNDEAREEEELPDQRLRLIFTCCHPALSVEAQVALTLRTLGGLTTPEIGRAFLVPEATLAQRIVRAKKKILAAGIPYRVPPAELLPERVPPVLAVLYLIFNEGYNASAGEAVVRRELCAEAIRLARVLVELMPDGEVMGLLALMLLHDSRRATRVDDDGVPVLLDAQDRSRWDRAQIEEGLALVDAALRRGRVGPYGVQGAIAALHAQAEDAAATDWPQIAALYGLLERMAPSPVVRLNRAVAVALAGGPDGGALKEGLRRIDALAAEGSLAGYHLLSAARADLLRRLGRWSEARTDYAEAAARCENEGHRTLMLRRMKEMEARAARK